MEKDSKIYIAGHTGLAGSAIKRKLADQGYTNLIYRSSSLLDLSDKQATEDFFAHERPEYVFLAAAKVGGVYANITYPAEFIYDNIQIQNNVIHAAKRFGVRKLMYFGSCCAYPTVCEQPIKETALMKGKLESTNESFAIAKLAGISMCQSYNKQYGTNFISVMPANLYGPHDDFDPKNSHVVGMAMRLLHRAKIDNLESVTLSGTGAPLRDFLYVEDLADACVFLMNHYDSSEIINIGTGKGMSKKDIAYAVKEAVEYEGEIIFNGDKKLDGMIKRVLDVKKINDLGWKARADTSQALRRTYEWFAHSEDK